jgi:hypothetical protein
MKDGDARWRSSAEDCGGLGGGPSWRMEAVQVEYEDGSSGDFLLDS